MIIMEDYIENAAQGISELARNTAISFSLEGWPATVAFISIPVAVVAIYAIGKLSA